MTNIDFLFLLLLFRELVVMMATPALPVPL